MPNRLTPEQRTQRAKIAAHTRWASEDPAPTAQRAQAGLRAKFERETRQAYPDLAEHEILRRAESAYKAHMARLAFRSAKARSRANPRGGGDDAAA